MLISSPRRPPRMRSLPYSPSLMFGMIALRTFNLTHAKEGYLRNLKLVAESLQGSGETGDS